MVEALDFWRDMARDAGLEGLHFVGMSARPEWMPKAAGFDAKIDMQLILTRPWVSRREPFKWLRDRLEVWRGLPTIYSYAAFIARHPPVVSAGDASYPCLVHSWDNTPRSGRNGVVLRGATPDLFRGTLDEAIRLLKDRPPGNRLLFLKAWNEWAEGNHLEPDLKFGHQFLQAVGTALGKPEGGG